MNSFIGESVGGKFSFPFTGVVGGSFSLIGVLGSSLSLRGVPARLVFGVSGRDCLLLGGLGVRGRAAFFLMDMLCGLGLGGGMLGERQRLGGTFFRNAVIAPCRGLCRGMLGERQRLVFFLNGVIAPCRLGLCGGIRGERHGLGVRGRAFFLNGVPAS